MKVYISADIEGVTGVTAWEEAERKGSDFDLSRAQMTAEVAAAARGFLAAGATEIWVKDAHNDGRNLLATKLPREVRLCRGWSGHPMSMVEHLEEGFQAAAMVGYHSRVGSDENPMSHTMSLRLDRIELNGRPVSELLLHGTAAARLGVPIVLVTGDEGICREATEVAPGCRTVAVMRGVGGSSINIHPELATERIEAAAREALSGEPIPPMALADRYELVLGFRKPHMAYRAGFYPGAEQVDERTVRLVTGDYSAVMAAMLFLA